MSARSLNKVQLIGNLTRDPELRFTPQGTAVCSFGLATNRSWNTDSGDRREETEFHRIVAWAKLAELCSQLLFKGRRIYVEGRLQTRKWTSQDGSPRSTTEVVIDDMIILDSKYDNSGEREDNGNDNRNRNYNPSNDTDSYTQGPVDDKDDNQNTQTSSSPDLETKKQADKPEEENNQKEEQIKETKASEKTNDEEKSEIKDDIPF